MKNDAIKQKQCILVDIHGTLLDEKDQSINSVIYNIVNLSKRQYHIILYTASYYASQEVFEKAIPKELIRLADNYYFNNDLSMVDDDEQIKSKIYNKIKENFTTAVVIDNNKKVCKMFKKLGISTLRFKEAE